MFTGIFQREKRYTERLQGGAVEWTRVGMAVFVSLIVLGSAVYIVLSKDYSEPSEKWAFGAIGTIVGFWFPLCAERALC